MAGVPLLPTGSNETYYNKGLAGEDNSSSSMIGRNNPPKRNDRLSRLAGSLFSLGSRISGKDELTINVERLFSASSDCPNSSHLSILMEKVDNEPSLIEEVLLRFSACVEWSDFPSGPILTCQILVCIHQIIRQVPRSIQYKGDCVVVFLNEIRNNWGSKQVTYLEQYASALIHHILTAKQYFKIYDSTVNRSIAGIGAPIDYLSMSFFDINEVIQFLSRLLVYQDRLLAVIKIPLFSSSSSTSATQAKLIRQNRIYSNGIIVDQSKHLLSTCYYIIMFLEAQNLRCTLSGGEVIDTSAYREQLDAQDKAIKSIEIEYAI